MLNLGFLGLGLAGELTQQYKKSVQERTFNVNLLQPSLYLIIIYMTQFRWLKDLQK